MTTVTTLSDGAEVVAEPTYDVENVSRAWSLGYRHDLPADAVNAMTRDHDAVHQALAHLIGLADSPTLRMVADGTQVSSLGDYEERVVFLFQAMLNGRDVLGQLRDAMGTREASDA